MTPVVSIIMGSTSDLPVMEKAARFLDEMEVPFEMHALSAHRTPAEVEAFAKGAKERGIKVIIAAAGMAAVTGLGAAAWVTDGFGLLRGARRIASLSWDDLSEISLEIADAGDEKGALEVARRLLQV